MCTTPSTTPLNDALRGGTDTNTLCMRVTWPGTASHAHNASFRDRIETLSLWFRDGSQDSGMVITHDVTTIDDDGRPTALLRFSQLGWDLSISGQAPNPDFAAAFKDAVDGVDRYFDDGVFLEMSPVGLACDATSVSADDGIETDEPLLEVLSIGFGPGGRLSAELLTMSFGPDGAIIANTVTIEEGPGGSIMIDGLCIEDGPNGKKTTEMFAIGLPIGDMLSPHLSDASLN